jgi:hypothetical protein
MAMIIASIRKKKEMATLTSIDDVATFKIRNVSPEFDFFFLRFD